jgi:hypothetical protein
MHFSKIAAVLSFAAFAVAAPAAAEDSVLVARTGVCASFSSSLALVFFSIVVTYQLTILLYQSPNACKSGGKWSKYDSSCPAGDSYYCASSGLVVRSTHILFSREAESDIASHKNVSCNNILNNFDIILTLQEILVLVNLGILKL